MIINTNSHRKSVVKNTRSMRYDLSRARLYADVLQALLLRGVSLSRIAQRTHRRGGVLEIVVRSLGRCGSMTKKIG